MLLSDVEKYLGIKFTNEQIAKFNKLPEKSESFFKKYRIFPLILNLLFILGWGFKFGLILSVIHIFTWASVILVYSALIYLSANIHKYPIKTKDDLCMKIKLIDIWMAAFLFASCWVSGFYYLATIYFILFSLLILIFNSKYLKTIILKKFNNLKLE